MTLDDIRTFCATLSECTEEPHFDSRSFRVRGKIFATVPKDGKFLHLFVDDMQREWALAIAPDRFETLYWGKKVAGLRTALDGAPAELVARLLKLAWARRAPKQLVATSEVAVAVAQGPPSDVVAKPKPAKTAAQPRARTTVTKKPLQ